MLFEACSKEELHSPIMSEEQTIHEITADCENTMYDGYISLEDARKDLESILADFSTISKCSKGEFSSRKIADCFTMKSVHPSLSFAPIEEGPNFKENISKSKDYKYQYKITAVTGIRK